MPTRWRSPPDISPGGDRLGMVALITFCKRSGYKRMACWLAARTWKPMSSTSQTTLAPRHLSDGTGRSTVHVLEIYATLVHPFAAKAAILSRRSVRSCEI